MANNLILEWTDFTQISDLNYNGQSGTGIYVWGFTINNIFVPYYVGIANNILLRMFEHINNIISGKYTIYHKDSLVNFKNYKNQMQPDYLEGKIYISAWPGGYKTFIEERKVLQPHIDYMVDTFTFSFAVVDREHDLRNIEKICIDQIGTKNLANKRVGIPSYLNVIHHGNEIIKILMHTKYLNPPPTPLQ